MAFNDGLLNAGFALGGGLGSMPVALPYSLGGAVPGVAFQGGDAGTAGLGTLAGAALPMGMMNRDGQQFMGQQQQQPTEQPKDSMSQGDMMKLAGMAMQGFSKGQQAMPSGNTSQIIRDNNQFRFAGMQQSPQMLANALRNR